MRDDAVIGCGAGFDDLARDEVGIDYWEGVGRAREEGRDGGFAGRNGAGEAEEQHCGWLAGREFVCEGLRLCCVGDRRMGTWSLKLEGPRW